MSIDSLTYEAQIEQLKLELLARDAAIAARTKALDHAGAEYMSVRASLTELSHKHNLLMHDMASMDRSLQWEKSDRKMYEKKYNDLHDSLLKTKIGNFYDWAGQSPWWAAVPIMLLTFLLVGSAIVAAFAAIFVAMAYLWVLDPAAAIVLAAFLVMGLVVRIVMKYREDHKDS